MVEALVIVLMLAWVVCGGKLIMQLNAIQALLRAKHQPSGAQVTPTPAPDGLSEVLVFCNGEWLHHDWVRDKSPRWQHYYDTPGYALRKGGQLEEGAQ